MMAAKGRQLGYCKSKKIKRAQIKAYFKKIPLRKELRAGTSRQPEHLLYSLYNNNANACVCVYLSVCVCETFRRVG